MVNASYAPIALFVYSRLDHLKETVNALKNNYLAKDTDLFVFSDGPKNKDKERDVALVRKYVHSIKGFKSVKVYESRTNKGLANSIIFGVTKVVNKKGKVIVVEDDIVTSKYFLKFMNDALNFYENNDKVISISGYTYPVSSLPETFFIKSAECWGWATWKRGWNLFEEDGQKLITELEKKNLANEFNYNGQYDYIQMLKDQIAKKNSSWAIRWYATAFLNEKLTLYPKKSLVQNIGIDGTGTHGGIVNVYYTTPINQKINVTKIEVKENKIARQKFVKFFKKSHSKIYRALIFITRKVSVLLSH